MKISKREKQMQERWSDIDQRRTDRAMSKEYYGGGGSVPLDYEVWGSRASVKDEQIRSLLTQYDNLRLTMEAEKVAKNYESKLKQEEIDGLHKDVANKGEENRKLREKVAKLEDHIEGLELALKTIGNTKHNEA